MISRGLSDRELLNNLDGLEFATSQIVNELRQLRLALEGGSEDSGGPDLGYGVRGTINDQLGLQLDSDGNLELVDGGFADSNFGGGATNLCRATLSSGQTHTSTNQLVNLDTVSFDTGSDFDTTNHYYKCPTDGKYLLSGSVGISVSRSDTSGIAVFQATTRVANGSFGYVSSGSNEVVLLTGRASRDTAAHASAIVNCSAGDTLRLYSTRRYEGTGSGGTTISIDADHRTNLFIAKIA